MKSQNLEQAKKETNGERNFFRSFPILVKKRRILNKEGARWWSKSAFSSIVLIPHRTSASAKMDFANRLQSFECSKAIARSPGLLSFLDGCMPPVANFAARIRVTVLEVVMEHGPPSAVQSLLSPSTSHVLSCVACIYLMSAVLATTRALNLFTFHPIFMSLGVLAFMTEGFLVYRNGALVSTFSDIMGGSEKTQARSFHVVLQICGSVFLTMGLVIIGANKIRLGKSLLPASLHAWVGTLASLLVAIQGIVGPAKLASPVPVHKWHGSAGKLAYDCCMLAVLTGAVSFLPFSLYNIGAEFTVLVLWASSELQHTMAERKARHGNGNNSHSGAGGIGSGISSGTLEDMKSDGDVLSDPC